MAEESSPFKDGVEMIVKQLVETLGKMGVNEIEAVGKPFDPNVHNAVMHVDDEELEENSRSKSAKLRVFEKGEN